MKLVWHHLCVHSRARAYIFCALHRLISYLEVECRARVVIDTNRREFNFRQEEGSLQLQLTSCAAVHNIFERDPPRSSARTAHRGSRPKTQRPVTTTTAALAITSTPCHYGNRLPAPSFASIFVGPPFRNYPRSPPTTTPPGEILLRWWRQRQ